MPECVQSGVAAQRRVNLKEKSEWHEMEAELKKVACVRDLGKEVAVLQAELGNWTP